MPTTIVNFYIECEDQVKLEKVLRDNGFAFYDATANDMYTLNQDHTLDEIEASLEMK